MFECIECGKGHYAIGGSNRCSACVGQKNRKPKVPCKECGKPCLNSNNSGICGVCRGLNKYREANIPNCRRCEKCNRVLRTKKECITICTRKECGGATQYYKTLRANAKATQSPSQSLCLEAVSEQIS